MNNKFLYLSLLFFLTCAKEESQTPNTPPTQIVKQYALTASAGDGGSVSGGGTFASGTQVSVTATPSSGYSFSGWSNGSTTNPLTVTLNSNTTITANFQAIVNSYTLSVTPGEGGSVSSEGGEYEEGTEVTFTATPDEGYGFIGWNGSDSTSSTITVTLNANTTIEPIFRLFPQFTFPETPSKMFTKGVGDTLSIGFSHPGGYKSTSLSAEFGSVSVISEPAEGDTDGNIIIEYTVNTVENVDRMTTIAGFDDIEINISGNDDLENSSTYQIRSQPEPVFKDYLKSSHDLVNSRVAINPGLIRFINEKDNSQEVRCDYINGGLNQFGNLSDGYAGIAFADVNGDGYDDMLLHPIYSENSANNFTIYKVKFELYLYEDGEFKFHEMDFGSLAHPKAHLARKILVGDFDNDGDPDFYSANFGIDFGSYETEKSFFIINNYDVDGTFAYKENPHMEGSHEASSGDIDNDGDLDIYSYGRLGISQPSSPFYKNIGNFELQMWSGYSPNENIILNPDSNEYSWQYNFFNGFNTSSELVDVNQDGFVDLILAGHEWDKRSIVLWGSENGFNTSDKTIVPQIETTVSFPMGLIVDIKVADLNYDGKKEIIFLRTGGGEDGSGTDIGYFYSGWYIQVMDVNDKELNDITEDIIDTFYRDNIVQYACANPSNNWIYWISINDYDNDGNLDIYNKMLDNIPFHRWEWNGSKYIKVD
ncbi:VCBS repeat-containing protein [Flavobacteriaceae bacterium]|nr:VCBS repeat-containing protein [Flavobacteriaceae bacterium]MDC0923217.1 VCBS repeat-containing protein [Flavobacteriaceae bacterium]MDC6462157.1 VCBS repeat-containing protein [Flavobacteriaceae bacterium]